MAQMKGGIVRSNLKVVLAEKEAAEQRRITQEEISDATGLRRATISKWMSPTTQFKMIDTEALTKLMQFANVPFHKLMIVEYPDESASA